MRGISLIAAVCLATACEKHDSNDILTSGMSAHIVAEAGGDGTTTVSATLYLGNPASLDFIELQGDDRLVALVDGQEATEMTEGELLNIVVYHTNFDTDLEDTEFEVQFIRTIDDGAPSSTCTLPNGFELTSPIAPNSEVSRATEIQVDWAPFDELDDMRYEIRGGCIEDVTEVIQQDGGGIILPANTLVKRMGDNVEDSCAVTLTIYRHRAGELDPGYGEGGWVECRQVRSLTFTSIP